MRQGGDYFDQITLARPKKIERQFEMHPFHFNPPLL